MGCVIDLHSARGTVVFHFLLTSGMLVRVILSVPARITELCCDVIVWGGPRARVHQVRGVQVVLIVTRMLIDYIIQFNLTKARFLDEFHSGS